MAEPPDEAGAMTPDAAWSRLVRMCLADVSVDEFLSSVTEVARHVVPGVRAASVTMLGPQGPETPAYSGSLAVELDHVQYRLGRGPCLQAAVLARTVHVVDAAAEDRWPGYSAAAAARGALSSLSVPVPVTGPQAGALNLYGESAAAFVDPSVRESAVHVAAGAGAGMRTLRALEEATGRAANLQAAMQSREAIEQAKGILMERHRITAEVAFAELREASQTTNRKLREVAEHLVTTGELLRR